LKIKLKGRYFDTIEEIEAELQAVLNTLKEHNFRMNLKNDRITGNSAYAQKGTTNNFFTLTPLCHTKHSSPEIQQW
jgi:hypothetical protein